MNKCENCPIKIRDCYGTWCLPHLCEYAASGDHVKMGLVRDRHNYPPPDGAVKPQPAVQDYLSFDGHLGDLSRELVVARYGEDIGWLSEVPTSVPVTVYNKGSRLGDLPSNVRVVDMPNVQREAGTYLTYIVVRYDDQPDLTFFLQGNPFDHGSKNLLRRVGKDYTRLTCLTTEYLPHLPEQWIKDQDKAAVDEFGFAVRMGDALIQAHTGIPAWFDRGAWHYLFSSPLPDRLWFGYGAQWVVPRDSIRCRSREFYRRLLAVCDDGVTERTHTYPPCNPWSLEGLWGAIWDPRYSTRVPDVAADVPVKAQAAIPKKSGCGCGGSGPMTEQRKKLVKQAMTGVRGAGLPD